MLFSPKKPIFYEDTTKNRKNIRRCLKYKTLLASY